ncbi:MAG: YkvA family protein [Filifactoraceae bacterium]
MSKKLNKFKFISNLIYFKEFFSDSSVSLFLKAKTFVAILISVIYFFVPIDIIPDVFLGFGLIEDACIIFAVMVYINNIILKYKTSKHKEYSNIIDVDFEEIKK